MTQPVDNVVSASRHPVNVSHNALFHFESCRPFNAGVLMLGKERLHLRVVHTDAFQCTCDNISHQQARSRHVSNVDSRGRRWQHESGIQSGTEKNID